VEATGLPNTGIVLIKINYWSIECQVYEQYWFQQAFETHSFLEGFKLQIEIRSSAIDFLQYSCSLIKSCLTKVISKKF
jgi:hypothetical protein